MIFYSAVYIGTYSSIYLGMYNLIDLSVCCLDNFGRVVPRYISIMQISGIFLCNTYTFHFHKYDIV